MAKFTAIIEKSLDTGLYLGYVPGFTGARAQAETLDELHKKLHDIIITLLEDGPPALEAEFIGTQTITVK